MVQTAGVLDSSVLRDAVPVCEGGCDGSSCSCGDDCRCGNGCMLRKGYMQEML